MCTCVSTLVPRFSRNAPTFRKLASTSWRLPERAACAAAARFAPTCAAFWCNVNTAKMSPKTMPTRISAIPLRRKRRRALIAANPASSCSRVEDMLLNAGDPDMALRQAFSLLTNYYYLLYLRLVFPHTNDLAPQLSLSWQLAATDFKFFRIRTYKETSCFAGF